jgi:riboflavin kinase/FMN adenylyltransferase
VFAPSNAPATLTTLPEKLALLERGGVDEVLVVRSRPTFFQRDAQAFVEWLVETFHPRVVVEGPTFTFGRGRSGDVAALRKLGEQYGFSVVVVDPVRLTNEDPPISSSLVRRLLEDGWVHDARRMLGRPHRIVGTVGTGTGRGTPLGIATANLAEVPHLVPAAGVYACIAQRADSELLLAAVNVGEQPTFAASSYRIEAHLLDFGENIRGETLGLHFLRRLRDQQKFDHIDELLDQVREDVSHVRELSAERVSLRRAVVLPLGG